MASFLIIALLAFFGPQLGHCVGQVTPMQLSVGGRPASMVDVRQRHSIVTLDDAAQAVEQTHDLGSNRLMRREQIAANPTDEAETASSGSTTNDENQVEEQAGADTELIAEANESTVVGADCTAPVGIENAASPFCAEGTSIGHGTWCSPSCVPGMEPSFTIPAQTPEVVCSGGNFWGSKLCCSDGHLLPKGVMTCVADVFSTMDVNSDGEISKAEYDHFEGTNETSKGAVAEKKAVQLLAHASKLEKVQQKLQGDDADPLVFGYLLVSTSVLVVAAICALLELTGDHHSFAPSSWSCCRRHKTDHGASLLPMIPQPKAVVAAPECLKVIMESGGAFSSHDFSGVYHVVKGSEPNGLPLWQKKDAAYFLFSGPQGKWFIGDEDEKKDGFKCDRGVVQSKHGHGGCMPDKVGKGNWMRNDGLGKWNVEETLEIVLTCVG